MKQTAIPAHPNRHDYRHGLDETLKRKQLADIIKQDIAIAASLIKRSKIPNKIFFGDQTTLANHILTTNKKLF